MGHICDLQGRRLGGVRRGEALDRRWRIAPTGGIDKVASFLALFGANKLEIAVLTDFHRGDKNKVHDLKTRLLRAGRVFTADEYAGQVEADIEDIIGRANYVDLVNKCYELEPTRRVPAAKPNGASQRALKEVEAHFATLPPGAPTFDHYAPAEFLVRQGAKLRKVLPDLEGALDRFERLFRDLNQLLA